MALQSGEYTRATDGTHVQTDGVRRYVALLTQSGADAPVAAVLDNSLGGALVWARVGAGSYTATLAGAFPDADKVFINAPRAFANDDELAGSYIAYVVVIDANTVKLVVGGFEVPSDNRLNRYPIEILVYP